MSEWIYYAHLIAANQTIGNQFAGLMGFGPDDNKTFSDSRAVRLRRTSDGEVAWYSEVPLKQSGYAILTEVKAGGYPQVFLDAGITPQQIDAARAVITLEVGDRATYEGNGLAFIAANGYEIIPQES